MKYIIEHLYLKENEPFELDRDDQVVLLQPDENTPKVHIYILRRYRPPTY